MKKIKTFEAACKALAIEAKLPDVAGLPQDQQEAIISHYKLVIIAQALNEGWKPDWTNSNEYKYYPWFDMRSVSGLAYFDCDDWHSLSYVGSRLCFKTREIAKYAGTQFKELYEKYFLIQ